MSLNTSKTKIIVFNARNKTIKTYKHLDFRISIKKVEPFCQVWYLGVKLQDNLNWNAYLTSLIKKFGRSTGLLSKVKHVQKHILRTMYHSIFNPHLIYACEVRRQIQTNILFSKLTKLQNKVLRLINFQPSNILQDLYTMLMKFKKLVILQTTKMLFLFKTQ